MKDLSSVWACPKHRLKPEQVQSLYWPQNSSAVSEAATGGRRRRETVRPEPALRVRTGTHRPQTLREFRGFVAWKTSRKQAVGEGTACSSNGIADQQRPEV